MRGHKAAISNPNVSEEAKEHSRQVLKEMEGMDTTGGDNSGSSGGGSGGSGGGSGERQTSTSGGTTSDGKDAGNVYVPSLLFTSISPSPLLGKRS
jgi:hypothetical protein